MKTENKLSKKVELVLETTLIRIVKVVQGWDKGTILIQNQNDTLTGWGTPIRVGEEDMKILINNLK